MEVEQIIIAAFAAFVGATISSEFESWAPWVAEFLRRGAVSLLPPSVRERMGEEFANTISETPGSVGKILQASSCYIAPLLLRCGFIVDVIFPYMLNALVSIFSLVFFAPIFILSALFIKLEDGGDVFVRNVRLGRSGRPIHLLAFRTQRAALLGNGGRSFIGKYLYVSGLNILPLFVNVLRGDIDLVGPYAIDGGMKAYLEEYDDYEFLVSAKPGIISRDGPEWISWKSIDACIDRRRRYLRSRNLRDDLMFLVEATFLLFLARPEDGHFFISEG